MKEFVVRMRSHTTFGSRFHVGKIIYGVYALSVKQGRYGWRGRSSC